MFAPSTPNPAGIPLRTMRLNGGPTEVLVAFPAPAARKFHPDRFTPPPSALSLRRYGAVMWGTCATTQRRRRMPGAGNVAWTASNPSIWPRKSVFVSEWTSRR